MSTFYIVKSLDQPTLLGCHFKTELDMDLRFFAKDHKYSQVIITIKFEKVKNLSFKGGVPPYKNQTKLDLTVGET